MNVAPRLTYACAQSFKKFIPDGAKLLALGGPARDETGRPVAYNAPHLFFWTDRKGFSIPIDQFSPDRIQIYILRGAGYFILEKHALRTKPKFDNELRNRFTLLAECDRALLFKL